MELNYNNILLVLSTASGSQRNNDQQSAESQLKQWETCKGYHYLLQSAYNDNTQSLQIRWLAIICLKNGVEKYWRHTRINSISKEEKIEIKKNLFNRLNESNNQLTIQNAHTIARICRLDFPVDWPTLFEDLTNILESCNNSNNIDEIVKINNLLIILNQILKNLAAVRIGKARISMQNKIPILLPHLIKFYILFFNKWTSNYDTAIMEVGYICLKTIRRSIVDGFIYPHREKSVQEFFELTLQHFQKLLVLHETTKLELLERYLKCYMKLYFNLVNDNSTSFILMSSSKNILLTLLSLLDQKASLIYNIEEESNGNDFWEKLAIKSFLILKKLTIFAYKKGAIVIRQRNDKQEVEVATNIITKDFFTPSLLEKLVELIINWYLKLRPSDLENWSVEPEEWVTEELQVSWEFQIRPCAENYFQDLAFFFKDFLSGFILNKIENTLSNPNIDILTKDSILSVFQLSANAIGDKCDFHNLFTNYFLPEALKIDDPNYKIIKRRVCLIISEWISIQCLPETRIEIYKLILNLLNSNVETNDKVVRLTSIQTLQHLIDDWEFRKFQFKPFLDDTIFQMLSLLKQLEFTECKMFVLKVLSLIIERTNPLIDQKMLIEIMSMVPLIWESSNSENEMIIKNSLLRVLKDLTVSLNSNSDVVHEIVIPLIPACCDPSSEFYSLLCEDGLELWSVVLKQLPNNKPIPDSLLDEKLFQYIINGLVNWTEILPLILNLIRSYSILNAEIFESEFGLEIFKILGGYLSTMRDDSLFLTCQILEILIIKVDADNIQSSKLISNFVEGGLFNELIKYIIRDSENPNCEIKVSLPILRLIKHNSQFFLYSLQSITLSNSKTSILFNKVFSKLMSFMRMIFDSKVRKLYLLALLSLYDSSLFTSKLTFANNSNTENNNEIEYELSNMSEQDGISVTLATKFNKILNLTVHFLEETQELLNGDCLSYHRQTAYDDESLKLIQNDEELIEEGEDPNSEYVKEFKVPDSGERIRFTEICLTRDPIHTVNFKSFLKNVLGGVLDGLKDSVEQTVVGELELICIFQIRMDSKAEVDMNQVSPFLIRSELPYSSLRLSPHNEASFYALSVLFGFATSSSKMHLISKGWISFKKPNRSTDQPPSLVLTGESTTPKMKNSGNGLFSLASTATTIVTTDIDSGIVSSFTSIEETSPRSNFSKNSLEETMNKNLQGVYGTFYPFLLNSIPQKVKFNELLESVNLIENTSKVDGRENCYHEINGLRIDSMKERTNCLSIEDDYYDTFPIGFTPKISSKIPLSNETRNKLVKFSCFNQFTKYYSNAPVVDLDYGIQPKPKFSRTKKRYNAFKKLELYRGVKFIMKVTTNPNLFDEWNDVEQTDYEENVRLQKLKELFTHWKKYEIVEPKLFFSTPYNEAENFRRRQVRCYGRNNGLYEEPTLVKTKNKYQYSASAMYRPPTPLNPKDFNEDIFLEEDIRYIQSIYIPDPENGFNTYNHKRLTKSAGEIQVRKNERPIIQCRIYSEPTYGTRGDLEFLGTDVVWHKEDFITLSR